MLRDTDGRREGVISRGAAITEPDVVLGAELVDLVRQVDKARPGFARKLFQLERPEELAFLREAAYATNVTAKRPSDHHRMNRDGGDVIRESYDLSRAAR